MLVVAVSRLAVFQCYAVFIDVADTGGENTPASGRRGLENRCELETARQIEDSRDDQTMTFIGVSRTEVGSRVELEELVLGHVAKVSGLSKPGYTSRERVVGVQLVLVRITSLEGDGECIIPGTSIGLGYSDAREWRRCAKGGSQLRSVRGKRGCQHAWRIRR